jgi:hypothetical protein
MTDTHASISRSDIRAVATALSGVVQGPDQLDEATSRIGIPSILVNPYLATEFDLTDFGLGKATYIPVQISVRTGGRKSLYFLHAGERALSGIFVTSHGIMYRYTTRESGGMLPAQSGDQYSEEIRDPAGHVVAMLHGRLEVTDAARGQGRVVFEKAEGRARAAVAVKPRLSWIWILWSMIASGNGTTHTA